MAIYNFSILDPRNIPAAQAANDLVFQNPVGVLGIEVTVPALAERCTLGNLDPQHSGGSAEQAAIEAAWEILELSLPLEGATMATVRVDVDSVGAMAALEIKAEERQNIQSTIEAGYFEEEARWSSHFQYESDKVAFWERLKLVAESDRFAKGGWPGQKALPTRENPWPEGQTPLAAIGAAVADFKLPLEERVALMRAWLLTGEEPAKYRASYEAERADMIRALEEGRITARTAADGRVAIVESAHRAATNVGYSLAPIVVALNPEFRFQGGEPHRKFTVAQFEAGYLDLRAAFAGLNELDGAATPENRWGGTPTVGGSPQGVSSILTADQVVEVVSRHLLR